MPPMSQETEDSILQLVRDAFGSTLAVYTGHPSQGYVTADKHHDLLLQHPGSSVASLGSRPPNFVIYEQVLTTAFPFMMHVTGEFT